MTRLPRLTGKEVISALRKFGFVLVRVKGSHHFMLIACLEGDKQNILYSYDHDFDKFGINRKEP